VSWGLCGYLGITSGFPVDGGIGNSKKISSELGVRAGVGSSEARLGCSGIFPGLPWNEGSDESVDTKAVSDGGVVGSTEVGSKVTGVANIAEE